MQQARQMARKDKLKLIFRKLKVWLREDGMMSKTMFDNRVKVMSVSRRQFVSLSGVLSLMSLSPLLAGASRRPMRAIGDRSSWEVCDTLKSLQNQTLSAKDAAGNACQFRLSRVSPRQVTDTTEQFAAVFQGAATRDREQGSYTFEHPQLGEMALLLVPGDDRRNEYVATFTRHRLA